MKKNFLIILHNSLHWRVLLVLFLIFLDVFAMTFWDLFNLDKDQREWLYFKTSAFVTMIWIVIAYNNLKVEDEEERYTLSVLNGGWIPYGVNWMVKELFFDPTKKEWIDYVALGIGACVALYKLKFKKVVLK